eukprot:2205869-Prymnesium_polylepis.1
MQERLLDVHDSLQCSDLKHVAEHAVFCPAAAHAVHEDQICDRTSMTLSELPDALRSLSEALSAQRRDALEADRGAVVARRDAREENIAASQ